MSAVDMTLFQVRVDEMIVVGTSGDEMNTDKLPEDEMTIDEMPVDKLTCCSLVTVSHVSFDKPEVYLKM